MTEGEHSNKETFFFILIMNPPIPKSDCLLISSYSITVGFKHLSHKNKGNDHPPEKPLIVKQVLCDIILENIQRTVWRICILMLLV